MITPISQIQPSQLSSHTQSITGDATGIFSNIFQSAIDNVKQTDAEKTQAEYQLATGQLDNPATLTVAGTKAELAVDLLVQLRNKALDAYSELTRISL